jgi:hypothetical protein
MFPGLLDYSSQIKRRRSLLKLLVFLLFFLIGFTITLCHLLFFLLDLLSLSVIFFFFSFKMSASGVEILVCLYIVHEI